MKLKPCPCCRGKAQYIELENQFVFVACLRCEIRGKKYSSKIVAAQAWNRRIDPIKVQMLEALEAIANEDNVYTKRNQYRLCCKFQGIAIAAIKVVKDEI